MVFEEEIVCDEQQAIERNSPFQSPDCHLIETTFESVIGGVGRDPVKFFDWKGSFSYEVHGSIHFLD